MACQHHAPVCPQASLSVSTDSLTDEGATAVAMRATSVTRAIQQHHIDEKEADQARVEQKEFMERVRQEMLPQIEARMKEAGERDPAVAAGGRGTMMAAQHGKAVAEWTGEIDRVKTRMDKILSDIEEEDLAAAGDKKAQKEERHRKYALASMRNKTNVRHIAAAIRLPPLHFACVAAARPCGHLTRRLTHRRCYWTTAPGTTWRPRHCCARQPTGSPMSPNRCSTRSRPRMTIRS